MKFVSLRIVKFWFFHDVKKWHWS